MCITLAAYLLFTDAHEPGDLSIRITHLLELQEKISRNILSQVVAQQAFFCFYEVLDLLDKPWVDQGKLVNAAFRHPKPQGVFQAEDAVIASGFEALHDI